MSQRGPMGAHASIRRATRSDAEAIAEVQVRTWQVAYRGQLPDELLDTLSVERRASNWRRMLDAGDPVFVAARADALVGFASVGVCRDEDAARDCGEVYAIYVEPASWGLGLGRALIERSVDELRGRGHRDATLWVLEANSRARRFYEAAGWFPDGGRKTEQQRGAELREVRYRRRL
jgi:GNAT superfamily N-acetyltransferase